MCSMLYWNNKRTVSFPGRRGRCIGRDAEPSDQRSANGSHLRPPGVGPTAAEHLKLFLSVNADGQRPETSGSALR